MKNFKLINKKEEREEERKNIEQQKKETNANMQNKNLNFIQKNPQTATAIFIGFFSMFGCFVGYPLLSLLINIFVGEKRLSVARKIGENKNFIIVGDIFLIGVPMFFWILSIFAFVIGAINNV